MLEVLRGRAPEMLLRTNINGKRVAATGGMCLAAGQAAALAVAVVGAALTGYEGSVAAAVGGAATIMFFAGTFDDLRGDEMDRGFEGHLRAAARGRLTGGLVKIAGGVAAGAVAGGLVSSGRGAVETALLVALTANFFNLVDRAPGRAGKVAMLVAAIGIVAGPASWVVASAGLWGGLAALLPRDLAEEIMLGDSGANMLGAVAGLGLALALPESARVTVIVSLVLLTLASERWSFSRAIEANALLRSLDLWGRPRA